MYTRHEYESLTRDRMSKSNTLSRQTLTQSSTRNFDSRRQRQDGQMQHAAMTDFDTVFDTSIYETEVLRIVLSASTDAAHIQFCQFPLTVTAVAHDLGTVYERAGSASHVTCPLFVTTIYLYWNEVPAGSVTVPSHAGF